MIIMITLILINYDITMIDYYDNINNGSIDKL